MTGTFITNCLLEKVDKNTFVSKERLHQSIHNHKYNTSYGGVLASSSIAACLQCLGKGYETVSINTNFIDGVSPTQPTYYKIKNLREHGSQYKFLQVDISQNGKIKCVTTCLFSKINRSARLGTQPTVNFPIMQRHSEFDKFLPLKLDKNEIDISHLEETKFSDPTGTSGLKFYMVGKDHMKDFMKMNHDGRNFDSKEVHTRSIHMAFKLSKEMESYNFSETGFSDEQILDLASTFISDALPAAIVVLGLSICTLDEVFAFSTLSHSMYFHRPPSSAKCSLKDTFMGVGNVLKVSNGVATVGLGIYNRFGDLMSYCMQDCLILFNNKKGNLIYPKL